MIDFDNILTNLAAVERQGLAAPLFLAAASRLLGADWERDADGVPRNVGRPSTLGILLLGSTAAVHGAHADIFAKVRELGCQAEFLRILDADPIVRAAPGDAARPPAAHSLAPSGATPKEEGRGAQQDIRDPKVPSHSHKEGSHDASKLH